MEPSEYCSKWASGERGVMKRNEGRNERSGMRNTEAAVRNEEELQEVWQTAKRSEAPEGHCQLCQYHKKNIKRFIGNAAMVWRICLRITKWRTPYYLAAWVVLMWELLMPGFILKLERSSVKSKCHEIRMALAVGSRRWLIASLMCWLIYRRLMQNCSIELQNVQVSDTTKVEKNYTVG